MYQKQHTGNNMKHAPEVDSGPDWHNTFLTRIQYLSCINLHFTHLHQQISLVNIQLRTSTGSRLLAYVVWAFNGYYRHGDGHSMDTNRHGDGIMNIIFMYLTMRRKSRGVPVNNGRISKIQDTRYKQPTNNTGNNMEHAPGVADK